MNGVASVRVVRADYANALHAQALLSLLDVYARDPMGGGEPLSAFTLANLVPSLAARFSGKEAVIKALDAPGTSPRDARRTSRR